MKYDPLFVQNYLDNIFNKDHVISFLQETSGETKQHVLNYNISNKQTHSITLEAICDTDTFTIALTITNHITMCNYRITTVDKSNDLQKLFDLPKNIYNIVTKDGGVVNFINANYNYSVLSNIFCTDDYIKNRITNKLYDEVFFATNHQSGYYYEYSKDEMCILTMSTHQCVNIHISILNDTILVSVMETCDDITHYTNTTPFTKIDIFKEDFMCRVMESLTPTHILGFTIVEYMKETIVTNPFYTSVV